MQLYTTVRHVGGDVELAGLPERLTSLLRLTKLLEGPEELLRGAARPFRHQAPDVEPGDLVGAPGNVRDPDDACEPRVVQRLVSLSRRLEYRWFLALRAERAGHAAQHRMHPTALVGS